MGGYYWYLYLHSALRETPVPARSVCGRSIAEPFSGLLQPAPANDGLWHTPGHASARHIGATIPSVLRVTIASERSRCEVMLEVACEQGDLCQRAVMRLRTPELNNWLTRVVL
jgi:hypothetical protein